MCLLSTAVFLKGFACKLTDIREEISRLYFTVFDETAV